MLLSVLLQGLLLTNEPTKPANILAGLVGSFVGQSLLGTWGPKLAGMALIPSIVGAIIVVIVTSFVLGKMNN